MKMETVNDNHIQALQEKHAGLERRIHEEESRPFPDEQTVKELKRQKLRIKEEIQSIH